MHTVINESGSGLSGGQRQRILIARSVVHRPRILFFDEATSALDNQTQAIVSRSLDAMQATRIVIAHRLSRSATPTSSWSSKADVCTRAAPLKTSSTRTATSPN